jgi:hypothetical protein
MCPEPVEGHGSTLRQAQRASARLSEGPEWHAGQVTTAAAGTEVEAPPRFTWALAPAFGVSFAAFLLFGIQHEPSGYAVLAISVILGFVVDRDLGRSLLLIGFGIGMIGTISLAADISYGHMALMGGVLLVAVVVPYVVDRFVFKRHIVRFPIKTGRRWTTGERWWVVTVVGLAWLILPFYFITSGTYLNWPAVSEPSELIRLFIAVNAVGLWDELFFICTAFALLRHHFRMWQANVLVGVGLPGLGPVPDHPIRAHSGLPLQPHSILAVRRLRALDLRLCAVGHTCARPQSGLAANLHLLLMKIAVGSFVEVPGQCAASAGCRKLRSIGPAGTSNVGSVRLADWPVRSHPRGFGAVGSALPWHGRGQGFESPKLHH